MKPWNADENKLKLTCTDLYGNNRTLVYNIDVIELTVKSAFNANVVYKNTNYPDGIDFRYSVVGLVDKTVYFKLDGKQVAARTLAASTSGKETSQILPINLFSHGSHKLAVQAIANLDGKEVVSNLLEYDILIHIDGETAPMISSAIDFATISEGELINIPYIVFDPNDAICAISLKIYNPDGTIYEATEREVDQTVQTWSTRKYPVGEGVKFSIIYAPADLDTPVVKTHTVNITKSTTLSAGINLFGNQIESSFDMDKAVSAVEDFIGNFTQKDDFLINFKKTLKSFIIIY